jgi:3-phenylpropionate/trans-cinnamate dioxygenase ferredoxin subunit
MPDLPASETWIDACAAIDIEPDDVLRFDHGERSFALYRTADDRYYATDGFCTHARVHLAGGLVMDHLIECPKHNGRFDFTTGKAQGAPACINLATYAVRVEQGRVLLRLG